MGSWVWSSPYWNPHYKKWDHNESHKWHQYLFPIYLSLQDASITPPISPPDPLHPPYSHLFYESFRILKGRSHWDRFKFSNSVFLTHDKIISPYYLRPSFLTSVNFSVFRWGHYLQMENFWRIQMEEFWRRRSSWEICRWGELEWNSRWIGNFYIFEW